VSTLNRLITLNNGIQMPILGFGVFQIPADETKQAVIDALDAGYRLLDTAASYGNEDAVGSGITKSGIAREDLFVTTKLWVQDTGEENTKLAFDASLQRLGLDYLELYLIHQPLGDVYGSWRAMQDLNREGRVRAIGVANFHSDRLVDLVEHNDVTPAVNQIETHPFFQRTADQEIMRERGVQHQSWGPFAEGKNNLFSDPVLTEIGADYGKSVAQVVLRWLIQRDIVVIPKSVRADRMAQNIDVFDFELTDEQMARIASMDTGASLFFDHRDPAMVSSLNSKRRLANPGFAGHQMRRELYAPPACTRCTRSRSRWPTRRVVRRRRRPSRAFRCLPGRTQGRGSAHRGRLGGPALGILGCWRPLPRSTRPRWTSASNPAPSWAARRRPSGGTRPDVRSRKPSHSPARVSPMPFVERWTCSSQSVLFRRCRWSGADCSRPDSTPSLAARVPRPGLIRTG
jgi:2,5-diketo-D-gluconate reductase A